MLQTETSAMGPTTFQEIQDLVSEVTGNEPDETTPSTYLEEYSIQDFPRIVSRINKHFGVFLNAKEVIAECETIGELVSLVEDEKEFEGF